MKLLDQLVCKIEPGMAALMCERFATAVEKGRLDTLDRMAAALWMQAKEREPKPEDQIMNILICAGMVLNKLQESWKEFRQPGESEEEMPVACLVFVRRIVQDAQEPTTAGANENGRFRRN